MISIQEVPHDERLPQLAIALDIPAIQGIFQEMFLTDTARTPTVGWKCGTRSRFRIHDCQIERVKYKPRKKCTICYRLTIHDVFTKEDSEQILVARIFTSGKARSRFTKAQSQNLVCPKFGRPLTYLPELDMVVWAFPNDCKLRGLPKIVDADCLKEELLPEIITAKFGRGWHISNVSPEIAHYVPQDTCTVRVRVLLQQARTGERQSALLYGKIYADEKGAEIYGVMRELWESHARQSGQLRIAQPLGYHPQLKILWQLGLPGTTLLERDMVSPHFLTFLRKAAVTVATLHRSPGFYFRTISRSDSVARLRDARQILSLVRPSCQESLDPLIDRLLLQSENLGEQPVAVVHGDLHLKNVFVDGDQIALIDMDNLCHGSPWQDVASFIAYIVFNGIVQGISSHLIQQMVTVFCEQYQQNVPWKARRSVFNWYMATALINERASRCLRKLKAGNLDILDTLIDLASQISLGGNSDTWILSEEENRGDIL
ncbi:MAG: aminoglycoside phosphotransferase family protein [Candidatus Binatia bacterium]